MEIKNYNVRELTLNESVDVNGGIIREVLLAIAKAVIEDWDNFKNGIAGKPEIAKQ